MLDTQQVLRRAELWLDVSWEKDSLRRVSGRLNTVLTNSRVTGLACHGDWPAGRQHFQYPSDGPEPGFFPLRVDLEVNDVEHMRAIIALRQANMLEAWVGEQHPAPPEFHP